MSRSKLAGEVIYFFFSPPGEQRASHVSAGECSISRSQALRLVPVPRYSIGQKFTGVVLKPR